MPGVEVGDFGSPHETRTPDKTKVEDAVVCKSTDRPRRAVLNSTVGAGGGSRTA
jgi:hypothetical protein